MLHFDSVPPLVHRLLSRLTQAPALDGFHLGDGTSLALRYGHRLSVDLDFFSTSPFDPQDLAVRLDLPESTEVGPRAIPSLSMRVE